MSECQIATCELTGRSAARGRGGVHEGWPYLVSYFVANLRTACAKTLCTPPPPAASLAVLLNQLAASDLQLNSIGAPIPILIPSLSWLVQVVSHCLATARGQEPLISTLIYSAIFDCKCLCKCFIQLLFLHFMYDDFFMYLISLSTYFDVHICLHSLKWIHLVIFLNVLSL